MPNVPLDPLISTGVPRHPVINTRMFRYDTKVTVVKMSFLACTYHIDVINYRSVSISTMVEYLSYVYYNSLTIYYMFQLRTLMNTIDQTKTSYPKAIGAVAQ